MSGAEAAVVSANENETLILTSKHLEIISNINKPNKNRNSLKNTQNSLNPNGAVAKRAKMGRRCTLWLTFGALLFSTQWLDVISSTIERSSEESYEDNAKAIKSIEQQDSLDFFSIEKSNEDTSVEHEDEDHDFDILIFTQQWPVTTCYHWREEDSNHACSLPEKKEFWTIHGVWPTKLGHMGPSFCNKSADFDLDQLDQILANLKTYWPTIDGQQKLGYFWKHEWLKHGTCAASLEELDNELKYFKRGLAWREQYLMSNILGGAGIHPDSNSTVIALQRAIVQTLGKNPSIHCVYDNKRDMSYLEEIRICFTKQFELTDCDGVLPGGAVPIVYPGGTVITNCHISKPIHYPSNVPPTIRRMEKKWRFPVVNAFKLVQFIMWFTL